MDVSSGGNARAFPAQCNSSSVLWFVRNFKPLLHIRNGSLAESMTRVNLELGLPIPTMGMPTGADLLDLTNTRL